MYWRRSWDVKNECSPNSRRRRPANMKFATGSSRKAWTSILTMAGPSASVAGRTSGSCRDFTFPPDSDDAAPDSHSADSDDAR